MKPALSTRQAQVAEMVAHGLSVKAIAHDTGLAVDTVRLHINVAASKIPGHLPPRHKLTLWFFNIADPDT